MASAYSMDLRQRILTAWKSRHIQSPEIGLVTEALAKDWGEIGGGYFNIRMDRFVHEGRELDNVEAELRGNVSEEIVLVHF